MPKRPLKPPASLRPAVSPKQISNHEDTKHVDPVADQTTGPRLSKHELSVIAAAPLNASRIPPNVVLLPISAFRMLSIMPGAVVTLSARMTAREASQSPPREPRVESQKFDTLVLTTGLDREGYTSHSSGQPVVALHPETLSFLPNNDAVLRLFVKPVYCLRSVVLQDIRSESEWNEKSYGGFLDPTIVSGAFRRQFLGTLVFEGMIFQVTVATKPIRFRCCFGAPQQPMKQPYLEPNELADLGRIIATTEVVVLPPPFTVEYTDGGKDRFAAQERIAMAPAIAPLAEALRSTKDSIFFTKSGEKYFLAEGSESSSQHLLIVGPRGCGKSHAIHLIEASCALNVRTFELKTQELLSSSDLRVAVKTMNDLLLVASAVQPSLVIIDDVDLLIHPSSTNQANPSHSVSSAWGARLVTASLVNALASLEHQRVSVVATASDLTSVGSELQQKNCFSLVLSLCPPTGAKERLKLLAAMLLEYEQTAANAISVTQAGLQAVAENTHGFVAADLRTLVLTAASLGFKRSHTFSISDPDLVAASHQIKPSALKALEVSVPRVTWNDIGGSEEAKTALQECVQWSLGKQREVFDHLGLKPPRGVLLYGPPGCSKTMLAKALAYESGLNFISVKGPEVFSKWVGDSEKAVRDIFTRARSVAPCVVFVDELDGMCGHRGSGGVGDRVISQFLTELDGLPSSVTTTGGDRIVFLAATNRPDNIDPAVLRPGRIDRKVHVGLPQWAERCSIAAIGLRGIPHTPDVQPSDIATRTEGYSGAEVIAVCKEAAFQAVGEDVNAQHVTKTHVDMALAKVKPRLSTADVEWYKKWSGRSSH